MSDERFCYHCRRYHPSREVQLVDTRNGKRWRCTSSLAAGRAPVEQRDAFGRLTSASNQSSFSRHPPRSLPHCLRERERRSSGTVDELA